MSFERLLKQYFRYRFKMKELPMSILQKSILSVFLVLIYPNGYTQKSYDSVHFVSPLDIPLVLAGNFAELRPNHFHTGIDIKTLGVEGKKVYAVEEGYVSRIKIAHYGYGRSLYVTHPNGYTTVYAHLQRFSDKIEAILKQEQYKAKTELVDVVLDSTVLPVTKKEMIALSGNSGSSTAPHLHFEIRDTKTEYALNPLLFHFDIEDNIKPIINGVKLYALDNGFINGKNEDVKFAAIGSDGIYAITKPIEVDGEIGFAIHTIDKLNGAPNKCGAYQIDLFVDGALVISQKLDHMNFDKNRYINAYKDYEEYHKNSLHYHRSFLLPNNTLDIYSSENFGKVRFTDNGLHRISYNVYDVYGNKSSVEFIVKNNTGMTKTFVEKKSDYNYHVHDTLRIVTNDYSVVIGDSALYDNEPLNISYNSYKHQLSIGNKYIPAQKYFALQMNATHISYSLRNKTLIAKIDRGQLKPRGGVVDNNFISTSVKELGDYTLVMDTTAPLLKPFNFANGVIYSGWMAFKFTLTDNLSGVEKYNAYVDGEWVLAQYVPQKNYLFIDYAELKGLSKGAHTLVVEVEDERKNISRKEYSFTVK